MRRKKRAGAGKMPPIEFFESPPLHVRLKAVTPVHSSMCPLTASVVPVNEADNSWISPHFQETVASATRSRRRLVRGSLERDTVSGKSSNRSVISPKRRSVFRPLKFVGETTVPIKQRDHSSVTHVPVQGRLKFMGRNVEQHPVGEFLSQDQAVDTIVEPPISSTHTAQTLEGRSVKPRDCSIQTSIVPQSDLDVIRSEEAVLVVNQQVEPHAVGDRVELCVFESADDNVFQENFLTESPDRVGQFEIDTPDMDWIALVDQGKECPKPVNQSDECCGHVKWATGERERTTVNDVELRVANCQLVESKNPCRYVLELLSSVLAMTPPPSVEADHMSTVLASDTPVSDYGLSCRQKALRRARFRARIESPVT